MLWVGDVGVWYLQFSSIILELHWISPIKNFWSLWSRPYSLRYETSTIHLIDETFCKKRYVFQWTALVSASSILIYSWVAARDTCHIAAPLAGDTFPYLRSIAWKESQFGKPRDEVKNSTPPWPGASCSLSKVVDEENRRFFEERISLFLLETNTHTHIQRVVFVDWHGVLELSYLWN